MKHKFNFVNSRLAKIRKDHLYRKLVYNKISGPHIIIENRKLVNLSSNDYLGLGISRAYISQLQSSSRLVAGNDRLFKQLESKLASHKHQESALVFPTGYMANLGVIPILPQKGDTIISDELNHASIIDSCKLASAKKMVFKHNDMSDLENKLRRRAPRRFVITEGIFSMNGDFANLREIVDLCDKYNAILVLDDAHGDFVVGQDGRGSGDHFGVARKIDVYISSLSKGLGAFGGYVASRKELVDLATNISRPFIYTSALPNVLISIALSKLNAKREKNRLKLWQNVNSFQRGLESLGYQILSHSQIIPIVIGSEKKSLEFGKYLFDNGVFARPIRYPTVERGSARIRISVTAWLTEEIIMRSLDIFEKAGKRFGLL